MSVTALSPAEPALEAAKPIPGYRVYALMKRPLTVPFGLWLVTNLAWLVVLAIVVIWWKSPDHTASDEVDTLAARHAAPGASSLLSGRPAQDQKAKDHGTGLASGSTANLPIGQSFEAALKVKDPVERMAAFAALLRDLNKENLPQALAAIENASREPGDDALLVNFMRSWVRIDPAGAMDYALDNEGARKFYVRNSDDKLIREWATRDPAAAMAYLDAIPQDHKMNRHSLHTNFVKGMAERDLAGAAAYAEENRFGRERGESIDFLASTFMKNGGETALRNWLDGIDESGENKRQSYKEYAISRAAREIARQDPDSAKDLVEGYLGTDLIDGRALRAAADGIANRDPAEAVDWLMDVSQGRDRSYAVAETIEDWADDDPNAAATWLHGQELTPEMDPAVSAFAREITRDDPEAALAWSSIISNDRQRAETMIRIGRDWLRRDKSAAAQWIQQNEVDPSVQKYFDRYLK